MPDETPALSPEIRKVIEHHLEEAAQSGAGLADMPTVEQFAAALVAAIGVTHEDVALLNRYADDIERTARWCPPGYTYSVGEAIIDSKPSERAKSLRSISLRLQRLLPPQTP